MTDSNYPDLPEENGAERDTLWNVLGEVQFEQPSARMRQEFYKNLEQNSRPGLIERLTHFFGLSGHAGLLTAAACVLAGVGFGQLGPIGGAASGGSEANRLQALEQSVATLHRSLVLDRLQNDQPGKRLRGVIDAAQFVHNDEAIAGRLLHLATTDRVSSIRSAAVESLGSQMSTPAIGAQLMELLRSAESPFVQLALIDLVLRNGSDEQVDELLTLANEEQLYPDLQAHVLTTLERI